MISKINKVIKNEYFLTVLMAIISYVTMCKQDSLISYNIHSWLILCLLLIIFKKSLNLKKEKKYNKHIVIISFIFSFLILSGRILYAFQSNPYESFWRELFQFKSLIYLFGNFNIIYCILINVIPKLCDLDIKKVISNEIKIKPRTVFLISFIVIFLAWIPYFLSYYPATITPDSVGELTQIVDNFTHISNHHPVIHVLFIAIPFKIGMALFNNINSAVALSTITQMIILASIFAYLIKFLYEHKIKALILVLIVLYFAFVPMHGYYSIVMWKDVIFAGCLLLLTIQTIKLYEKKKITIKNSISFIIISILTVLFRNNAIYMYFIYAFLAFVFFRKDYKQLIAIFAIVFGTYFIINGPVYNYFDVTRSASSEYIAMPMQQIGRMAFKNVEFNQEEKELLNKLMPLEEMKKNYNPQVSDGIKFNKNYNAQVFDNNKAAYFKLWVRLVFKHPSIASEAYLTSTLGYWYPGVMYWSVANNIEENELGVYTSPKISNKVIDFTKKIEKRDYPIINITWSIGLCFWILVLCIYICKQKQGWKSLYVYVPVFGIWLTMLIASPVYAEFRYVYGAFTCLPLLMIYPFMKINKNK